MIKEKTEVGQESVFVGPCFIAIQRPADKDETWDEPDTKRFDKK